ncbi:MAG TPA: hypothetical protein PJ997_01540 [Candidatus Paceibacterota bacterium]|nr:hypothetical protein [Candidatus Paceibacterota bacterium]HMP19002.1 hypothetical protein [Candidatus Paceibacterota bacterium]HMP85383.1 hypothetical protein [Candidatus Paceibacterota bacterium]
MRAPSLKVSITILITGIIVSGIIIYSNIKNSRKNIIVEEQTSLVIQNQSAMSQDTDGDGLFDWEEVLWGTDPNNPDTDGDGTKDGDEVKLGRNPLIPGPNDKLESPEERALAELEKKNLDENSITAKFNNVLIKEYFGRLDPIYGMSDFDKLDVINLSIESIANEIKIQEKYKLSDLRTFNLLEEDKMIIYAQNFLDFHNEITNPINTASINNDYKSMAKILRNLADKLVLIEVPQQISGQHIDLINGYYAMAEAIENMSVTESDPVLGLIGLKSFEKIEIEQQNRSSSITIFLKANGISTTGGRVVGDGI